MLAFLGKPELKTFVLDQLAAHREADRLVKGTYWERGKGCAVGCTLESVRHFNGHARAKIDHGNHALYETELGARHHGAAGAWPLVRVRRRTQTSDRPTNSRV